MFGYIFNFFKTGPDRPAISNNPEVIKGLYERHRLSVFLTVTFGYAFYYVARINFAVVKEPMLEEGILSAREMGFIGTAFLAVYAVGKLSNGFLADRANIRRFMGFALLGSALVNLLLGQTTIFWVFFALWALNGWFQSIGSAPSVVSLAQWFSAREIGTRYGIWSASHGLGSAFTFFFTAAAVEVVGWRFGFWGPGLLCAVVAIVMLRTLSDRPQTYGLPPVSEYKDDLPADTEVAADAHCADGKQAGVGGKQWEVLRNPAIWALGTASALMYVARYGINSWGMLYLQLDKGYGLAQAGAILAVYTGGTVVGAIISGIVSDRVFNSDRNRPALLAGLVNVSALLLLFLTPPGNRFLDTVALGMFGVALGILLAYLGGLMAVDLSSKRAAGAAMGVIGGFSYLGAAIQDTVSGVLIESTREMVAVGDEVLWFLRAGGMDFEPEAQVRYCFEPVFYFWIGCAALSVLLTLTVWNAKPCRE